jgi:hypothetical protein
MHTQLVTWKHIAHGAVYDSLRHFLDGDSVYLPPRNLTELREVLYVFRLSLFFSFILHGLQGARSHVLYAHLHQPTPWRAARLGIQHCECAPPASRLNPASDTYYR